MSFKRTIVIAVIFLLVGGFYFFYEFKGRPAREDKKEKEAAVFSIKEPDVKTFTLTRKDGTFVFEKRDKTWYLKQPVEAKADQATLDNFVKTIVNAKRDETVEEKPAETKKYGLEKPLYELTLSDGTKNETLEVGETTVGARNFYARTKGTEPIFLVDTGFKFNLDRQTVDYRDRSIVDMPIAEIQKVIYHKGKATYTFEKKDNAWTTDSKEIIRPGSEEIFTFVNYLSTMKTKEFIENTPQKMEETGIKDSDFYCEIYGKDPQRPVLLRLGKTDEKLFYLAVDGAKEIYGLQPVESARLTKKPEDFLDHKLMKTPSASVYTLTAKIDGKEYVFKKEKVEKKDEKKDKKKVEIPEPPSFQWKMTKPTEKVVNSEMMDMQVLTPATNMYVVEAFKSDGNLAKYGLDKPVLYMKGQAEDGKVLFELDISGKSKMTKDNGQIVYTRLLSDNFYTLVGKSVVDKLIFDIKGLAGESAPAPTPAAAPFLHLAHTLADP